MSSRSFIKKLLWFTAKMNMNLTIEKCMIFSSHSCFSGEYLFNFLERNKRISGVKEVTLTDFFCKFISFYEDFWLFKIKSLFMNSNPFLIDSLFRIQISLLSKVSLSFLVSGKNLISPKMKMTDLRSWYWIWVGYWFFKKRWNLPLSRPDPVTPGLWTHRQPFSCLSSKYGIRKVFC